jgi:hypothetical protein
MYALDSALALTSTTGDGEGSNGVFVQVTNGDWNQDVVSYGTDSYLGKTDYPFNGPDQYPTNPLTVSGAAVGSIPLGITLNQTAEYDENGEKLLYNKTKKEELQAVLPGQSVPVATRGIFTLAEEALSTGIASYQPGYGITIGAVGKIGFNADATDASVFGTVVGTGSRASNGGLTDQFEGGFVVVKIGK